MRYMAAGRSIRYDAGLVAVNRVHGPTLSAHIDHLQTARALLQKYRAQADFRIRVKALREAYKKSRRKRYVFHLALLKIVLAFTRGKAGVDAASSTFAHTGSTASSAIGTSAAHGAGRGWSTT
jgi:hypothetical protein